VSEAGYDMRRSGEMLSSPPSKRTEKEPRERQQLAELPLSPLVLTPTHSSLQRKTPRKTQAILLCPYTRISFLLLFLFNFELDC
jgi:hypothetical protein